MCVWVCARVCVRICVRMVLRNTLYTRLRHVCLLLCMFIKFNIFHEAFIQKNLFILSLFSLNTLTFDLFLIAVLSI